MMVGSHEENKKAEGISSHPIHPCTQVPWAPGKGRHWAKSVFLNILGTQCRNGKEGRASPKVHWMV